ncbi:MAG TPA: hypothetical protein HA326_03220 [Thermoplasmata archaeon]|nr:hypothetical protein [Thermoplasmata archaeon]
MTITEAEAQEFRRRWPRRRIALVGGILAVDVAVLVLAPLPGWAQAALGVVATGALLLLIRDGLVRAAPPRKP